MAYRVSYRFGEVAHHWASGRPAKALLGFEIVLVLAPEQPASARASAPAARATLGPRRSLGVFGGGAERP
jgi:hypothetical protein